jgi:hypothetical protein
LCLLGVTVFYVANVPLSQLSYIPTSGLICHVFPLYAS